MKKKILLYTLCILFTVLSFSLAKTKNNTNILKIGTSADYPPFEYHDVNKIVGFDIDVMNLIASKLNKKTSFIDIPFSTLFAEIEKGKIDLVISGVTITKERKQTLNFSIPYYSDSTVLIVRNDYDEIKKLKDLEGKKVGTQLGTTQDNYADGIKNATNLKFKEVATAILNLKSKKVDAVITDKTTASMLLKTNKGCKVVNDVEFDKADMGIVVNKNNKELLKEINSILKEIKKNGELEKIKEKWNLL